MVEVQVGLHSKYVVWYHRDVQNRQPNCGDSGPLVTRKLCSCFTVLFFLEACNLVAAHVMSVQNALVDDLSRD